MPIFDETNLKILELLQHDGRMPNNDLADSINLSPAACLKRVRLLEKKKIIRAYTAIINPEKVNYSLLVFIEVLLDKANLPLYDEFRRSVAAIPQILECHMVAGNFDYLIKARCKDMLSYRRFLTDLLIRIPSIRETHTYTVMETVKSNTCFPLNPAELILPPLEPDSKR